ncbi:hypothetical protein [Marinisporobacter balticus]|uniref:Uncharacterized protein n=1 Tax=Marinisporobacter balticus TaxID=2018667 RepID=A0A4R2KL35_9FIRM|nr:hypothetical protein [Marinisporobacter balticus]TCO71376.1 hypothetical protein EV214_12245 [Marinisporobacter balticus]
MKKRNIGVIFGGFMIVALISGAVTFFMLSQQQSKNEKKAEQLMNQNIKDDREENPVMGMKEILDQVDEAYLESYLGASNIVEINDKDLGIIVAQLKSLDLKLLMKSDKLVEDIEGYNKCSYGIHIKNKNIKIKVNEKYVIIEDIQGGTQFFEGDTDQLNRLNEEIKAIYMSKYSALELFKDVKSLWIEAKDEQQKWVVEELGIEKLLRNIELIAPVDEKDMIGVVSQYPDYDINIETNEKNYKVHLMNEETVSLDTADSYAYYRCDPKLWKYIHDTYPIKLKDDADEFKVLLKTSKIIVDDLDDQFDFEDDTYYNVEIPRWIIQINKKQVEDITDEEDLMYHIKFMMDGEMIEAKIYENYIIYKGKNYYSEKIGEIIKSGLSV